MSGFKIALTNLIGCGKSYCFQINFWTRFDKTRTLLVGVFLASASAIAMASICLYPIFRFESPITYISHQQFLLCCRYVRINILHWMWSQMTLDIFIIKTARVKKQLERQEYLCLIACACSHLKPCISHSLNVILVRLHYLSGER